MRPQHAAIVRDDMVAGTAHARRPGSDVLKSAPTVFLYRKGFPLRRQFDRAVLRLQACCH